MKARYFFTICLLSAGLSGLSTTAAAGVCTIGHAHAGVTYTGGQFDLNFQAEGATIDGVVYNAPVPGVIFDAADIVILVPATTWQKSNSPQSAFLGLPAGDDYFRLSDGSTDSSKEKTVYFGFGTEAIDYGTFANNIVNFALTGVVAAPPGGQFSVYSPGPQRWMDTADGTFANDVLPMPVYTHGHYDFGFSKPGIYQVQFTASAQLPGGGTVSDSAVFTFDVPGSATWTKLGLGGTWGDVANWHSSAGGTLPCDSWVPKTYYDWATLASATAPATPVTLDAAIVLGRLTLGEDATATAPDAGYTLQAGNGGSLKLDRGHSTIQPKSALVEVLSGEHEIAAAVTLADNTEVSVAPASNLVISNTVSGSKALTKTGEGLLVLSGQNAYTGGTTIADGVLEFANALALPAGTDVTVGDTGVVVFSSGFTGPITAGSPTVVPEPSALTLLGVAVFGLLAYAWRRQ